MEYFGHKLDGAKESTVTVNKILINLKFKLMNLPLGINKLLCICINQVTWEIIITPYVFFIGF